MYNDFYFILLLYISNKKGGFMKKCTNCQATVEPKRKYNKGLFILFIFVLFPVAIVQYVTAPRICPNCKMEI